VRGVRRVRVVTDSTADLPVDLALRWGIVVIPLRVHFGEESFRDGMDLTLEEFYGRLSQGEFPTTSQPPMGEFKRVYEGAAAAGGEVISIHLSAELSGTCESALLVADQVDGRVAVVDSGLLSMGLGWLVVAAAEAARERHTLDEIVSQVEEMRGRIRALALIESVEHLRRGGRVGRAQPVLGSMLSSRAIVTLQAGEVAPLERVRTRRAGLRRLVELVAAMGALERVAVIHADAEEAARQVADGLAPVLPREDVRIVSAGQVVATHVGPGAVGVACALAR
jgi:DegV family protein with EDD domain